MICIDMYIIYEFVTAEYMIIGVHRNTVLDVIIFSVNAVNAFVGTTSFLGLLANGW